MVISWTHSQQTHIKNMAENEQKLNPDSHAHVVWGHFVCSDSLRVSFGVFSESHHSGMDVLIQGKQ